MTLSLRRSHGLMSVPCPPENEGSDSVATNAIAASRPVAFQRQALAWHVFAPNTGWQKRAKIASPQARRVLVKTINGEAFYGEDEVSVLLDKRVCSLRSDAARRVGPPRIRLGNLILYRAAALHDWILAHEREFVATSTHGKGGRSHA